MNNLLLSFKAQTIAYLSASIYKRLGATIMLSSALVLSACGGGGGTDAGGVNIGKSSVAVSQQSDAAAPSSQATQSSVAVSSTVTSSIKSSSTTSKTSSSSVASAVASSKSSQIVTASSIKSSSVASSAIVGASSKANSSVAVSSVKVSSSSTAASSVDAAALSSVEIAPGKVALAVNASQQLVAVGKQANGTQVNLFGKVTWRISKGSEFATVSSTGLLKRTAAGEVEVEATSAGKIGLLKLSTASQNLKISYDNSTSKWSKVNIHYWTSASNTTAWPGLAMTQTGDVNGIWTYEIDASKLSNGSINVIFNNGAGAQTTDATAAVKESATFKDGVWTPSGSATTSAQVSVIDGTISGGGTVFPAGTVVTINASVSTHAFSSWSGASAVYIFTDPYKAEAKLVVPSDITSMALQALFATENDPYKTARGLFASKCVQCHGINGAGGAFGALNNIPEGKYTLDTLAAKISTMPVAVPCTGTTAGSCAYDIAKMILDKKFIADEACTGNSCNTADSLDSRNLRLLTTEEYLNSARDIFGVNIDASVMASAIGDGTARNFNTSNSLSLDFDRTLGYQTAAVEIAKQVIASKSFFSLVSGCGSSDTTCAVTALGKKVFRRPLTSTEVARYVDLYTSADAGKAVIQGLLISPNFMYRSEMGTETASGSGLYRLSNYEVATLLAYTFWASTPDDALLTAAGNSTLDIKTQVTRLLSDARAERGLRRFAQGWLLNGKYGYTAITNTTLASALDEETIRFAMETIKADLPYKELLTANYTYANTDVAKHYGIGNAVTGWAKVQFPGNDPRSGAGILGHGSFLATRVSSTENPSPIKRGTFVRDVLMCQELPPPQKAGLSIPKGPNDTNRMANAAHTNDPACQQCHQYIDGVGFGFESFGSTGLFRTTETLASGVQAVIDASGSIKSLYSDETTLDPNSASEDYQTVPQLASLIAESGQGSACYSRQFYRYVVGRSEETADEKIIPAYSANLRAGGGMKTMLIDLAVNPSFILRRK